MFKRPSATSLRRLPTIFVIVATAFAGTAAVAVAATPTKTTYSPLVEAAGGAGLSLLSVSCAAPGDCTAVGNEASRNPIAASSTNGVWSPAVVISFGSIAQYTSPTSTGFAVSCATPGNCTAVGQFIDSSDKMETMSFSSVNGVWGVVQPTTYASTIYPSGSFLTRFDAIDCSAPGTCSAVGTISEAGNGQVAMTDSSSNGVWAPATVATFAPGVQSASPNAYFSSVSCPQAGDCTAVGQFTDINGDLEAMTESSSNGVWGTAVPADFASGDQNTSPSATFNSVSCSAPGTCTAAGSFLDSNGHVNAMTESSLGGTWSPATPSDVATVAGLTNPEADFTSVSCVSAGDCTAVGDYQNAAQDYQAFTQSSINGSWADATLAKIPSGVDSLNPFDQFSAVSCTKVGDCTAVGQLTVNNGVAPEYEVMSATMANGIWGQVLPMSLASLDTTSGTSFYGVDCTSPGNCAMAGDEYTSRTTSTAVIQTMTTTQAPSAPLHVKAKGSSTHVTVSWSAPATNGGIASLHYEAIAMPGKKTCSTTSLHCVIKGLKVTSKYSVTVTATNATGRGPASAKVTVKG